MEVSHSLLNLKLHAVLTTSNKSCFPFSHKDRGYRLFHARPSHTAYRERDFQLQALSALIFHSRHYCSHALSRQDFDPLILRTWKTSCPEIGLYSQSGSFSSSNANIAADPDFTLVLTRINTKSSLWCFASSRSIWRFFKFMWYHTSEINLKRVKWTHKNIEEIDLLRWVSFWTETKILLKWVELYL